MSAVGIDFGSEFSSVAVFKNGNVEVIADSQGVRRIPNIIAYTNSEVLIGNEASSVHARFPKATITHVRDVLGKSYEDIDPSQWMVKIVDQDGDIVFDVSFRPSQDPILVTPVEAVSKIFAQLKKTADNFTGSEVELCTVSVPTDFNELARNQVKEAATLAGFKTVVFIKDPISALLAYNFDHNSSLLIPVEQTEKLALVVDFGKNMNITVVRVENGFFTVLDTIYTDIKGSEIDQEIIENVVQDFKRKTSLDITENPRSLIKLSQHIEEAKKILSTRNETMLNIEALHEGIDYNANLSISKFEGLTEPVFQKSLEAIKVLFEKIEATEFASVLLSGGNCIIPRFKSLLSGLLGNDASSDINPFEINTVGAAIHANNLLNREVSDASLKRTAKDIGIDTSEGPTTP
eukprot:TRINITY_DN6177_c0_g1_i2.p1 TRINITY_DN6177_c0_g1~~TRINITY_DN6177_c0_g1_i2.p1  ORF type:complete len:406 (+),score=123.16 TRINITY_DN6177_c0_g1_i2:473-1690(+)